jgi:hypothetical protein
VAGQTSRALRPPFRFHASLSYLNFDKASYPWKPDTDYRIYPELYRVGRGEQGVLICQPYKDELVPLWRYRTPNEAQTSSQPIWEKFQNYLHQGDFVGADMARKFLQVGYTRSRRYANYKGGRKYARANHQELKRGTGDPEKAQSVSIFHEHWKACEADETFAEAKRAWKATYG